MRLLQTIYYIDVGKLKPSEVGAYMDTVKKAVVDDEAERALKATPNLILRTLFIPVNDGTRVQVDLLPLD